MNITPFNKILALKKAVQAKLQKVDTEYYTALNDNEASASTLTKLKTASFAYNKAIEDLNGIIDAYADIEMDLKGIMQAIKKIK